MAVVVPSTWNAATALRSCPCGPWSGLVWRFHGRQYAGDNPDGSLRVSGRFNRGLDKFPPELVWRALYTSAGPHVALGERLRHTMPQNLQRLANQRMSRLRVELQYVIIACAATGCAQLAVPGLSPAALCHPTNYQLAQDLAAAVRVSAEALLVPSCTGFPEGNLIIFPDSLSVGSVIAIEETVDPSLYVNWGAV